MRAGGNVRITLPCPESWKETPLYELAWTFSRINPHAPPVALERSNDGYTLILTFLDKK